MSKSPVLVVYITSPRAASETLARSIIQARVAACVNRIPKIQSTYTWKGSVEVEEEDLLMAKTTEERYPELERFVLEHHPYDEPEIIAVPVVQGSAGYLDWVREGVQVQGGQDKGE